MVQSLVQESSLEVQQSLELVELSAVDQPKRTAVQGQHWQHSADADWLRLMTSGAVDLLAPSRPRCSPMIQCPG